MVTPNTGNLLFYRQHRHNACLAQKGAKCTFGENKIWAFECLAKYRKKCWRRKVPSAKMLFLPRKNACTVFILQHIIHTLLMIYVKKKYVTTIYRWFTTVSYTFRHSCIWHLSAPDKMSVRTWHLFVFLIVEKIINKNFQIFYMIKNKYYRINFY